MSLDRNKKAVGQNGDASGQGVSNSDKPCRLIMVDVCDVLQKAAVAGTLKMSLSQLYKILEGERKINLDDLEKIFATVGPRGPGHKLLLDFLVRLGSFIEAKVIFGDIIKQAFALIMSGNGSSVSLCDICRQPLTLVGILEGKLTYKCKNLTCRGIEMWGEFKEVEGD